MRWLVRRGRLCRAAGRARYHAQVQRHTVDAELAPCAGPLAYGGNLYDGGPSVLAPDGQSGYFAETTGFVHVRFSDGKVLDTFTLGEARAGMWLSPDELSMAVAGTSHVFLVDLW